jgi:hypothetical protein
MARDKAYREAEKKIEEARRSGDSTQSRLHENRRVAAVARPTHAVAVTGMVVGSQYVAA